MLERFLVPLDTSRDAARVFPYVTQLAKQLGQQTILLAVVPNVDAEQLHVHADAEDATFREITELRRKQAQEYLDKACAELRAGNVWATPIVAVGNEAETIVTTADAQRAGLIAMATHGQVNPEPWFLGSVAGHVVQRTTTPVLLIRPRDARESTPFLVTAIIVPVDGSAAAESAFPYATFLAKNLKVPVSLVRALPPSWASASSHDESGHLRNAFSIVQHALEIEASDYLERTADGLRVDGVEVTTYFARSGTPASAITEFAEDRPGSLVVMTSHGRSGLARTTFGSVSDKVIRSSGAPVLLVRGAIG